MPESGDAAGSPGRRRTSRWLVALLTGISLVNLAAAVQSIRLAPELAALGVSYPVVAQAVLSLIWAAALGWAARGLWRCRNGAGRRVLLVLGAYLLYQAVWGWLFIRSDYALDRQPFLLLLACVTLGAASWTVYRLRL